MKLVIVAGPPSAGKTAVIRQIIKKFSKTDEPAYLKIDVVKAFEDEELHEEFGIPTRKVYSGDLCPDHMGIMVLKDAITWAEKLKAGILIIESAGLCLRCTPYTTQSFGIAVLPAVSGSNSPLK
ncbi:MAG: GTP-binding protein, partial [Methanoregula sp.]|uniref:GTP-binding protein n=1 Tax=Methanoregula sp. TaxID=2052170 RepID=UPI003C720A78